MRRGFRRTTTGFMPPVLSRAPFANQLARLRCPEAGRPDISGRSDPKARPKKNTKQIPEIFDLSATCTIL
jgi:hypothetical protein